MQLDDVGPAGPTDSAPEAGVAAISVAIDLARGDGLVPTLLSSVNLLTCRPLPNATTVATIGPNGGSIQVGQTSLVIPQGALSLASDDQGRAGLRPRELRPVLAGGSPLRAPGEAHDELPELPIALPTKRIVYTNESLKVLALLKSLDLRLQRNVAAPIDHFSRYAVAY